ncbi:nuclear transport factor 2 family protein [Fulvivirga maritima]|uniref:nuclear transport factor 2 family protein n=1 Tax=Fulvivirga maritima TaxID=2904247 RepID=UPI001F23B4EA|nr:nuclear transport factor 2 family protein [Fulvivirga maritima]UII24478.1 nuclear transport factor 2 family protein [Fulvivirga maritima]
MTENNKEVLKKANDLIMQGDNDGFLDFCTDDTKWIFVGDQVLEGKEVVRKWMATEYKIPPEFDVKHLIAEGDFVTAVGNITLTDQEGKSTLYAYCDVWRFENGKMAELNAFVVEPN